VPDAKLDARARRCLTQFAAASDPCRFRLLAHASLHGSFLASEAEEIAVGVRANSGNARTTHAERLARVGLVRRKENPVRYQITKDGRSIYEALRGSFHKRKDSPSVEEGQAAVIVSVARLRTSRPLDAAEAADDLAGLLEEELKRFAAPGARATRKRPG
jgi:hypothetical protein